MYAEQVQIVISQNGHRTLAECAHEAQDLERLRAAIDEISDEPEAVTVAIERDHLEQLAEFVVAALDVADRVGRHAARL